MVGWLVFATKVSTPQAGALSESETQVQRQRQRQPSPPLPLGKLLGTCFQVVPGAGTQVLALAQCALYPVSCHRAPGPWLAQNALRVRPAQVVRGDFVPDIPVKTVCLKWQV